MRRANTPETFTRLRGQSAPALVIGLMTEPLFDHVLCAVTLLPPAAAERRWKPPAAAPRA